MIEVNAAFFILLIEALILTLVIFAAVMFFAIKKRRRKRAAIALLVSNIKKQSTLRLNETGSFLKDIYLLEGKELAKAVTSVDKSEKQLFQKLIDSFLTEDPALISSMDASVAAMIDSYKELKPKQPEEIDISADDENGKLIKQIQELEEANKKLKEELGITKATMNNMIAEFSNMFSGGAGKESAEN